MTMQPQHNVCYLLHFDEAIGNPDNPRGQARHYLGYADRLDRRTLEHMRGRGAKITQALVAKGIGFSLVRTWPGDRKLEARLKRAHSSNRFCPICRAAHDPRQLAMELEEDLL